MVSVFFRDAAIRYRRLSQTRCEELREKLKKASQTIDELISRCLLGVEGQVANALCIEIRRLGEFVDSFHKRAFSADNEAELKAYKTELNAFIERELGRKLAEACAGDIRSQVVRAEQFMASESTAYWFANTFTTLFHIVNHVPSCTFVTQRHSPQPIQFRSLALSF